VRLVAAVAGAAGHEPTAAHSVFAAAGIGITGWARARAAVAEGERATTIIRKGR
jgi:hypothetical protein